MILTCIVYWQACEISRVLSECDPVADGIDLSVLEHVSPIEWDNVVLYGQYILDRKLVRRRRAQKESSLAYKITWISLVPYLVSVTGVQFERRSLLPQFDGVVIACGGQQLAVG